MYNPLQILYILNIFLLSQATYHSHTACSTIGSLEGVIESLSSTVTELTEIAKQKISILEAPICSNHDLFCKTTHFSSKITKEETSLPIDCSTIYKQGNQTSGIYEIWPQFLNHPISVFCDMETAGGGWTLLQRRGDFGKPVENFFRTWASYKSGFGNLSREFWLGNDVIFALTNQDSMVLRIDLEDFEGGKRYAEADEFLVKSERELYRMSFKTYKGDAGDSLTEHKNMPFSTTDNDNDKWGKNCADFYKGGWWYNACHHSNLNGLYLRGANEKKGSGVNWYQWRGHEYSLKISEMKIRPASFKP
ncbi:techylectin-5B-like [Limulus polyphemus]|uniref:Techylectin-5B-like n=1 Tax=Limulus polyphemus TaxID=6850 RepID=A0ABM1BH45_LIMPO|nr:techylectin-5B-like [Limulus polyphemus]